MAADIQKIITDAANKYGVPVETLMAIASIESNFDPLAYNRSGATGLFQFMPETAGDYGLTDAYDPVASADAAARLTATNAKALRKTLGREPTTGELYLAHQQGLGGARALLANPNESALTALTRAYKGNQGKAMAALVQNGGNVSMTAGEFAGKWTSKGDASVGILPGNSSSRVNTAYTSSREGVQRLQTQLKGMGFDPGKADGVMGPRTKAAIKEFQTQNGLVADGVVGPRTAAVLSTMGSTGVSGSQNPRNVSGIPVAAPTSTALAAVEQLAGVKPFTSVSNYTTSAPTPRPVAGSSGVRDVTSYRPVTPPVTPVTPAAPRQYNNMVPSAPVYQKPTGFNPYNFGGVNDVTSSYGRYVPSAPSGSRSSTTQTVSPSGVVTQKVGGASQVGTAAIPTGYRPKLNVIPQSNTYGAGISFPSGLGMSAKPASRPVSTPNKLTGFGGMTGTSMPAPPAKPAPLSFPPIAPKPNPLTGFGGMTGTYTPPAAAKPTAAPMRSRSTSGGSSSSSSGGSPSAGLSTVKLASGTVTTPGTYKSTNGYTYTVRSDGSVYNNTTGRVTAPATR